MSKSYRSLCVLFSRTGAGLCIYHLFVWSNLNFLHISQWITLPTQSCQVLYFFCANLLHSHIMWLIVSSLSPHSLPLLFCCVLFILAFIWLVLMALFCAVIRRDSVSLLKFPFLSHVQVLSCEMFISRLKCPLLLLLLLLLLLCSFQSFSSINADGLPLESQWLQVSSISRTHVSILADLNNAVVWMVSTRPLIYKSSSPCTKSFGDYQVHQLQLVSPSLSSTIVFFVCLFSSLARSRYLYLFSFSVSFTMCQPERQSS